MGLTVACVLRSGGIYEARHVTGIRAQVAHWMPAARFVCLSDVPVECERVPIKSGWPGWWSKVELFRHFKGRTLYIDLDSVIVADPTPLVTGEFLMVRNWVHPALLTSAVMSWDGDYSHISDAFEPVADRVMATYVTCEQWGDQAWIAEQAGNVRAFPEGEIARYSDGVGRKGYRIVAFTAARPPWNGPSWARYWWS